MYRHKNGRSKHRGHGRGHGNFRSKKNRPIGRRLMARGGIRR